MEFNNENNIWKIDIDEEREFIKKFIIGTNLFIIFIFNYLFLK